MSAQLAVTSFVLISAAAMFALPFLLKNFSKNPFLNILLKRLCFVIGLFLMVMNSALVAEIANTISADMRELIYRYMWFYGWAGYIAIVFTIIKTIFDIVEMYKKIWNKKRMGEEEIEYG